MGDTATMGSSVPPQEEVELTDDQIQQLLLEAENRLRGSDIQITPADDVASIRCAALASNLCSRHIDSPPSRIPRLSTSSALSPYMRPGAEEIATVDSAQLIDPKQKELSNSLRSATTKSAAKKVSLSSSSSDPTLSFFAMRKIFPTPKRLMRRPQSVLGCAALVRAFIFIVTLSIHTITSLIPGTTLLQSSFAD